MMCQDIVWDFFKFMFALLFFFYSKEGEARHRKTKKSDEKENSKNGPAKIVTFDVESLGLVCNESETEFQKVVQFSPDGSLLFTGSTEGILRAWEVSGFTYYT